MIGVKSGPWARAKIATQTKFPVTPNIQAMREIQELKKQERKKKKNLGSLEEKALEEQEKWQELRCHTVFPCGRLGSRFFQCCWRVNSTRPENAEMAQLIPPFREPTWTHSSPRLRRSGGRGRTTPSWTTQEAQNVLCALHGRNFIQ